MSKKDRKHASEIPLDPPQSWERFTVGGRKREEDLYDLWKRGTAVPVSNVMPTYASLLATTNLAIADVTTDIAAMTRDEEEAAQWDQQFESQIGANDGVLLPGDWRLDPVQVDLKGNGRHDPDGNPKRDAVLRDGEITCQMCEMYRVGQCRKMGVRDCGANDFAEECRHCWMLDDELMVESGYDRAAQDELVLTGGSGRRGR